MKWSDARTTTMFRGSSFSCKSGGDRDRGAGVAPHRLENDVGIDRAVAKLLGHHEPEIRVRDDDGRLNIAGLATRRMTC
jgi:hypothetical protein